MPPTRSTSRWAIRIAYSNFNVYSQEGTTAGAALGADTCFYFSSEWNDQTGGYLDVGSLDHFKNLYCEPEAGAARCPDAAVGVGHLQLRDRRPAHGRRG